MAETTPPFKVGDRIKHLSWSNGAYVDIEWINHDGFAGTEENGRKYLTATYYWGEWELVPPKPTPKKKPSERINEIYKKQTGDELNIAKSDIAFAFLEYLDEMAEG